MDLTSQQPNENGPVTAITDDKRCWVCKENIKLGEQYFYVLCGRYRKRRHTTCARKTPGKVSKDSDPGFQTIGQASNGRRIISSKGL